MQFDLLFDLASLIIGTPLIRCDTFRSLSEVFNVIDVIR